MGVQVPQFIAMSRNDTSKKTDIPAKKTTTTKLKKQKNPQKTQWMSV